MGLLEGKIAKIVIYDKARVSGGTSNDYLGQCWVPKLVLLFGTRNTEKVYFNFSCRYFLCKIFHMNWLYRVSYFC